MLFRKTENFFQTAFSKSLNKASVGNRVLKLFSHIHRTLDIPDAKAHVTAPKTSAASSGKQKETKSAERCYYLSRDVLLMK